MKQFVRVTEIAAPLLRSNIDTDQIIAGPDFMRSTDESDERWGNEPRVDTIAAFPEVDRRRRPWLYAPGA